MVWPIVGTFWLLIIVAGVLIWQRGTRGSANPTPISSAATLSDPVAPRLTAVSSGYVTLAKYLADPLLTDRNAPELRKEQAQLLAEAQVKISRLRAVASTDQFVQSIADRGASTGAGLCQAEENLTAADRQDGFGDLVAMGFGLYTGDVTSVFGGASSLLQKGETVRQARFEWGTAFNRARAVALMLPEGARTYGGPLHTGDQPVIATDFDESFVAMSNHDKVCLTNRSGKALSNCTLLVEIRGRDGDVRQNVHFVESWENGGNRYARYGIGIKANDEVYGRQTVLGVQELHVSVWADQLSQEGVVYRYPGPERDKDIEAELSASLKVLYNYHVHQFFVGGPTITLVPNGIGELPAHTVTLVFRAKAGTPAAQPWKRSWEGQPSWPVNQSRKFDLEGKLPFDPETMDIELSFPTTSYVYRRTVQVEKR